MATRIAQAARSASPRETDLLTTKFAPPRGPPVIVRPRLLEACLSGSKGRLTVLDAPAGYGKTTLLAEWYRHAASSSDDAIAWLSLADTEDDPVLFWRYVVGALRRAGLQVGVHAESILVVPGVDVEEAVRTLLNDLAELDPHAVLVLEDYHVVQEPLCHELMALLLAHAPSGLRVLISSRSELPLPLASLRAAGQLTEIRARDLRLTADEAREFLRLEEDLELSADELAVLLARTEGWAAALQLAAVWLRGEADRRAAILQFAGDNRHIVDYLGEQVLAGLEPPIERFLLQTSILDRLCAPLCDAVMGETGSARRLEQVERANLFLRPLDGRRRWYRYHNLFAGLLRAELARREPDLVPILHDRAYSWHRERGTVVEAVEHAMLAGSHPDAAKAIIGSWIPLIRSGRSVTVRRWLSELPEEVVAEAPQLAYVGAFVTALAGDTEPAIDGWLKIGEANAGRAPSGPLPDGTASFEANLDIIRAAFLYRNVGAACSTAERVVQAETPHGQFRVPALAALGFLRYISGDPDGAKGALDLALHDRDAPQRPHGVIHALATSALLELDAGDAEKAERTARRALETAQSVGLARNVTAGLAHLALARSLVARNLVAEALDEIVSGEKLLRGHAPMAHYAYGQLCLAEAQQAAGDLVAANRALDEAAALIDEFQDAGILPDVLAEFRRRSTTSRRRRPAAPGSDLSEAELAVLRLLAGSKSRSEIADDLSVSPNTVKTHASSIYRKLGVGSRADAVQKAREQDLL